LWPVSIHAAQILEQGSGHIFTACTMHSANHLLVHHAKQKSALKTVGK